MTEDTSPPDPSTVASTGPATVLTALEARILGVLVEKQLTVPDTYPLSLNALKAGCNQKNNRDPVISVTEAEIAAALDDLRARSLIIESSGSRTLRYEQNVRRVLDIAGAAVPLLAVLMLRGPQTAAELRLNAERMQRFADASSVEAFLRELGDHPGGALVVELPRRPGERERRWMHRLVPDDPRLAGADSDPAPTGQGSAPGQQGAPAPAASMEPGRPAPPWPASGQSGPQAVTSDAASQAQVASLEARIAALEARVGGLQEELSRLLEQNEQPPRWG